MRLDNVRQTKPTQYHLSFASLNKMTSTKEEDELMSLDERMRLVLKAMPGPDRGKQVRLAKIVDESKQTVNHWLTGVVKEIQYEAARRICDEYGFRMDWLMRGKGPIKIDDKEETGPTAENMALVYLTARELAIITNFRATDDIGQTVVEAAAEKMKKN